MTIESNVCISQDAIICSSGHDLRSPSLDYKHSPITIKRGSWVCLRANVLAGSTMEENSVLSAGQVLRGVLPRDSIMIDNEVKKINY